MKYTYNKLVRDKIPEEINKNPSKKCKYHVLEEKEYIEELNKKVIEEANEFIEENSVEELADLMEVLEAIMKVKQISEKQLKQTKEEKKNRKGAFEKRYYLETVEE